MAQRIITQPKSLTFKVGRKVVVTGVKDVAGAPVAWRMHKTIPDTVELRILPTMDLSVEYAITEPVLIAAAWPFPQ